MGDSPVDLHMAEGIPNPNVILRIGFLNRNTQENLIKYKVGADRWLFILQVSLPVVWIHIIFNAVPAGSNILGQYGSGSGVWWPEITKILQLNPSFFKK